MDPRIRDFVDRERAAWRPFEALGTLSDAALEKSIPAAHDWSGRDLVAHLVGWRGDALDVAGELADGPSSPARERSRRAFAARGDEINAEIQATWRSLPLSEVRRRLAESPEALRRAVAAVPGSSWDADAGNLEFFEIYTIEHDEDHLADLAAILAAAGADGAGAGA